MGGGGPYPPNESQSLAIICTHGNPVVGDSSAPALTDGGRIVQIGP